MYGAFVSISPTPTTHVVLDLVAWNESGALELSPKFQRRPVWKAASKSYFIDSLLRGFPVPPIHIRLGMRNKGAYREIIDGQQRLRAVFDFVGGRYRLSRTLEAPWAGMAFKDLDVEHAERLMMYKFHAFEYDNVADATILEIFARINTYSVPLSRQELRNGKYFGVFKTAMYEISREHLEFWRSSRLFSEIGIARMQEVEFVSELSILLMDGLQDKKTSVDSFYSSLDEGWGAEPVSWIAGKQAKPLRYLSRDETHRRFESIISEISSSVGDLLSGAEFSRTPLFYTLFGAVAHRLYGVPGLDLPTPLRPLDDNARLSLRAAMTRLSELVGDKASSDEMSGWQRSFVHSAARQTDNLGPRTERLTILWDLAKLSA